MTSALHPLAGPVALVALVALSSTARAEPARTKSKPAWPAGLPAAGPRNAVSFYPFALAAPGMALEYERFVWPRRLSLATGLGVKSAARGDYGAVTVAPSLELRVWLIGRGPFSELANRGMVGPYLSLREEVAFTTIEDRARDRLAGTAIQVVDVVSFGYRLTVGPVAFTPSHGAAVVTQLDPSRRLASSTTITVRLALAVGVLF